MTTEMTGRERFAAIMDYRPFDRLPVWFFGAWGETQARWLREGLSDWSRVAEETGMDPDWERGMWSCHGLVNTYPRTEGMERILEETDEHAVVRTPLGAVLKRSKIGECIPQTIEPALKPTREAWREFRRRLDPDDPSRRPAGWKDAAHALDRREHATCFLGGSLFAWPRGWMGIEQISYLSYDDPVLYEEIVETLTDFLIEMHRPVLKEVSFDFAYFFEDCCGRSGPLFSPESYRRFHHRHYKRLIEFYRDAGVKHVLVDSDGMVEPLIRCWMESGFDILFPIEVGAWGASPIGIRQRYGKSLRMLGGVNKHVIPLGEAAIRAELEPLRALAAEGGYIPIPDHRIPPNCSLEQFRTYVRVFKDVFAISRR